MGKFSWSSLVPGCYGGHRHQRGHGKLPIAKQISFQRMSFSDLSNSTGGMLTPEDISLSLIGSNLYIFKLAELHVATQGFAQSNFLGKGGFGPVYKGFVDEKIKPGVAARTVAVKQLDLEGKQGHKEWLTEVIFLGQLKHPNLVKLIGYCCEDEQRLLVYEFMTRGSLEKLLFKRYCGSLPWSTRLQIAIGAAKGLAFLHDLEKPVIYRDFKASNILLDSDYKAMLSDFGLAKDGPEGDETHVSTRVMGTQGYAAPEYILTGHLTVKSDVYGYGVVLLELLTGQRSVDKNRPMRKQNLVEWARPILNDPRRLNQLMDPCLDGQYSIQGAQKVAAMAYQCLSQNPKSRPHMSTVVETLEPLLNLKDMPIAPFVYIAPAETTSNEEESTKNEVKQRHKDRSPKAGKEVGNTKFGSPTTHNNQNLKRN
ncbi:serine/threonine-protein kinase RIPK-like [Zingiber officinale]|uniref:non-specific serine/threonine protein kinase n=1 Tax=Zingiber officinale TaxID=94328 RepID=A0A8J5KES5_ZINOF|nr:serine/threonine-protein kinase RIPK-like [Zingiber officinale]KAG6479142.1 hypothetical protein ZIOFF_062603 [Zingiber officinale]